MKIAGKPVRDARKPLVLNITDNDVKKSSKKDPHNCAAAVACKRQEHVKDVLVHTTNVYVDRGEYWERYKTPSRMKMEIVSFDRGAQFTADEYVLPKVNPAHRLGARDKRAKRRNHDREKYRDKKREYHRITNVRTSMFKNVWGKKEA